MSSIAIIVAVAKNGVIGANNSIPWHCPADLKYFKRTTMGAPIIMGRKTYQSLKIKPLPGRQNVVVTRDQKFVGEGCDVVHSLEGALAKLHNAEKIFVIGGAEIYQQALAVADELFITYVDIEAEGDKYFPEMDSGQWQCVSTQEYLADQDSPYNLEFKKFIKLK